MRVMLRQLAFPGQAARLRGVDPGSRFFGVNRTGIPDLRFGFASARPGHGVDSWPA